MNIETIANKMDISYDFYIRHNVHNVEWKLNAMINKNKKLTNEFIRNWRHPFIRSFENVPSWNEEWKFIPV